MSNAPQCTLPDAKLVVAWDQWKRIVERNTLPEGEVLRIPFSLWLHRHNWISPGIASDHMFGLPSNFLSLGILAGDITPVWGHQRKVPRAYLKVGDLIAWMCEHRIACNWKRWNKTNSYLRARYGWPEPPQLKGELK